nr:DUF6461 domain-containing protein [Mycolicibacterium sp. CBMA 213]
MTVSDYSWWRTWRPGWAQAHCVTLVSDITAKGIISSLHANTVDSVRGIDVLHDRTTEGWTAGDDLSSALIGVTQIDRTWALIAEINGFVGVTERLMGPMSPGRTIVSHFSNINAVHRFNWWHDGQLLVDFDLLFPAERFGADPAALLGDLGEVGLRLDANPDDIARIDLSAAGFALAQRITNVTCTPALFERSDFLVAQVAIPDGAEQQRYEEALRVTWHHPTTW